MNPSTKDILQAVESVVPDKIIILPNNKNIILTASQVHSLTKKTIKVVPTKTVPQGVAALLAFDYEADFDTNAKVMEKARQSVQDDRNYPGNTLYQNRGYENQEKPGYRTSGYGPGSCRQFNSGCSESGSGKNRS